MQAQLGLFGAKFCCVNVVVLKRWWCQIWWHHIKQCHASRGLMSIASWDRPRLTMSRCGQQRLFWRERCLRAAVVYETHTRVAFLLSAASCSFLWSCHPPVSFKNKWISGKTPDWCCDVAFPVTLSPPPPSPLLLLFLLRGLLVLWGKAKTWLRCLPRLPTTGIVKVAQDGHLDNQVPWSQLAGG